MPYRLCIQSQRNGCVQIESVRDDLQFADTVAAALKLHPAAPPPRVPPLSNALQGNLCEFRIWDLGERFWCFYQRDLTWTTNASSPWRSSSDPGIDILGLPSPNGPLIVHVIEVKSSQGGGSGSIIGDKNGETSEVSQTWEVSEEEDAEDEEEAPRKKTKGFSLVFDVARRFAQPLGIHLPDWEGRIIETDKGIVRLLAVTERAEQLFGTEGAQAVATEIEHSPQPAAQLHMALYPRESEEKRLLDAMLLAVPR